MFIEELEPIDEALENRLQDIQQQTDEIMAQVAAYRRSHPEQARLLLQQQLEDLQSQLAQIPSTQATPASQSVKVKGLTKGQLAQFEERVARLAALQQAIPPLVAKLGRAREVILEESQHAHPNTATGGPTQLTEAFAKQHRVEKQMALASLLLQKYQ